MKQEIDAAFFENLFERIPGPLYVVKGDERIFHRVNPAFAELMETSRESIEGQASRSFVHAEDWHKVVAHLDARQAPGQRITFAFRALTVKGNILPLEVSVIPLAPPWESYEVGVIRNLTDKQALENRVVSARHENLALAQMNNRLWHLAVVVGDTFKKMEALAAARDVDELLKKVISLLTAKEGLACSSVTIYLQEGNRLVVAASSGDTPVRSINLDKNGRFARIYYGTDRERDHNGNDTVCLLHDQEGHIGLLRVIRNREPDRVYKAKVVQDLFDSVLSALGNILSLLIRNIRLYKQVEEQSIVDALTRVHNRRYFDLKFSGEMDRAARYQHPLCLVLLDIDRFKPVNDEYGHLQGDRILAELGELLQTRVRKSDVLCRYGGEEFVILLPMTPLAVGRQVAEGVRRLVASHAFTDTASSEKAFRITVSIGLACYSPTAKGTVMAGEVLIEAADQALYRAKSEGRNRVILSKELT